LVQVPCHVGQADGQGPRLHAAHQPVVSVGRDEQNAHLILQRVSESESPNIIADGLVFYK
jgi:hypothetical protein